VRQLRRDGHGDLEIPLLPDTRAILDIRDVQGFLGIQDFPDILDILGDRMMYDPLYPKAPGSLCTPGNHIADTLHAVHTPSLFASQGQQMK